MSIPMFDSFVGVSIGHQHVQARDGLVVNTLMALFEDFAAFFVVWRDNGNSGCASEECSEPLILDELSSLQSLTDCVAIGSQICIIFPEFTGEQLLFVKASPRVAGFCVDTRVVFECFCALANLAFQL